MIKTLEKLLTKIPMYPLIGGSLGALVVVAFIAALFGLVSFHPLGVLASAAIFVLVSVVSNIGLSKLYGVQSHLPSAAITGLILTFLFIPTLTPLLLVQYALIAVIAQSSKYVIAYRKRHIFNPAAFGAFAGGLLQLQFASWWAGSPVLALFVAIGGFLLLYKTRQLLLAGTFLAVSLAIFIASGVPPFTAILSYPLLFLAGFMLSEPLTLPPLRWQKLLTAITMALVVSLPFSIGWFYSSPEFAVLVGNLLAFVLAFRWRKGLQLRLIRKSALTPTTTEFTFGSPSPIYFKAGQYIELTLPHTHFDTRGQRRYFSVTSAPGSNEVSLGVKFYQPSSTFKHALAALPIDANVQATGISGDFVLPTDPSRKLLFVAGGIGITPFISQIANAASEKRDITILYFVSSESEKAYTDQLTSSGATVHYIIGSQLTSELLKEYVADASSRHAYVSGPPAMVADAKSVLRGKVKSIKADYFSGY